MPPVRQILHEPYQGYLERIYNAACHQDNGIEQESSAISSVHHTREQQVSEGHHENGRTPAYDGRANTESNNVSQPVNQPQAGDPIFDAQ
jgi:hypothetical protein